MATTGHGQDAKSLENEKASRDEFREVIANYNDEQPSEEVLAFKRKEAKLVKKLDVFVAPVMLLLMLISYLDRGCVASEVNLL